MVWLSRGFIAQTDVVKPDRSEHESQFFIGRSKAERRTEAVYGTSDAFQILNINVIDSLFMGN